MYTPAQKKRRLFRSWTSRHPMWCAWQVTYRCNFRCRFCGYWHDPMGLQPEPDVSQYALGARKLAGFGTMMISLAGGEPFLRQDLGEIVYEIGRYHFPFATTNGWFVTENVAREIMQAGAWGVSVSIDYADRETHDAARGMDGAWEQAWRAVELLSEARVHPWQRVNVMAVLLRDNIDQLDDVIRMAHDRDAYFMIQPYGQAKTGSAAHIHNDGPVAPKLLALHRKHPNFLSNPIYLSRFDEYLAGGIPHCRAGRAFFNIDAAGDVAICVEHKHEPVGNLYRDPPSVLHQRLRRRSKTNRCTACWYNCRGEVESLYQPRSLLASLPTYIKNHGRPSQKVDASAEPDKPRP